MLIVTMLVSALATAPAAMPRDCGHCGVYAGPNAAKVLDPYLRRVDIWPEFFASTCEFEVARGSFVKLSRSACTSEANYRVLRGLG